MALPWETVAGHVLDVRGGIDRATLAPDALFVTVTWRSLPDREMIEDAADWFERQHVQRLRNGELGPWFLEGLPPRGGPRLTARAMWRTREDPVATLAVALLAYAHDRRVERRSVCSYPESPHAWDALCLLEEQARSYFDTKGYEPVDWHHRMTGALPGVVYTSKLAKALRTATALDADAVMELVTMQFLATLAQWQLVRVVATPPAVATP